MNPDAKVLLRNWEGAAAQHSSRALAFCIRAIVDAGNRRAMWHNVSHVDKPNMSRRSHRKADARDRNAL